MNVIMPVINYSGWRNIDPIIATGLLILVWLGMAVLIYLIMMNSMDIYHTTRFMHIFDFNRRRKGRREQLLGHARAMIRCVDSDVYGKDMLVRLVENAEKRVDKKDMYEILLLESMQDLITYREWGVNEYLIEKVKLYMKWVGEDRNR